MFGRKNKSQAKKIENSKIVQDSVFINHVDTLNNVNNSFNNRGKEGAIVIPMSILCVMGILCIMGIVFSHNSTNSYNPDNGDTTDISVYEIYLSNSPSTLTYSNMYYSQGTESFEQADYEAALLRYEEAIKSHDVVDVDLARMYYAEGMVYERLGAYKNAVSAYNDAIGVLESLEKEYNKSQEDIGALDFEKLIEVEPHIENIAEYFLGNEYSSVLYEKNYVYYLRAIAHYDMHDIGKAVEDLELINADYVPYYYSGKENEYFGISSIYMLRGLIYERNYGDNHSEFSKENAIDYGYTDFDAFEMFNWALKYKEPITIRSDDKNTDFEVEVEVEGYNPVALQMLNAQKKDESYFVSDCRWGFKECDYELASILTERAAIEHLYGYYDKAIEDCAAALIIFSQFPERTCISLPDALFILSYATMEKELYETGEISMETREVWYQNAKRAMEYNETWLGECFNTAVSYENMMDACMKNQRYDEALNYCNSAIILFKKLGKEDDVEKNTIFLESIQQIIEHEDEIIAEPGFYNNG